MGPDDEISVRLSEWHELQDKAREAIERVARLESVLAYIAFQDDVNALSGNPMKWPSEVAYMAIGGKYKDGKRASTREDFVRMDVDGQQG